MRTTPPLVVATLIVALAPHPAFSAGEHLPLDHELRVRIEALHPLSGESVGEDDLAGHAVIVSFFASWCPPCRKEFHHLNEIFSEFAEDDVTIVAINVFEEWADGDGDSLTRFLADTEPKFHVVEGTAAIKRDFDDVQRIPTVFIFDRSGQRVMHFIHERGALKTNPDLSELRAGVQTGLQ